MSVLKYVGDWSEQDVVRRLALHSESDFLKVGGNSFCHKIIKALQQVDLLVENSGHDCLPPDYYSDNLNIMFDVMRVNDSEKKKSYNPVFQEVAKLKKEAKQKIDELGLTDVHYVYFDLDSDNGRDYDEIHQFGYYKKQTIRVLNEHIKKLHIWQSEHPNIDRKGFVVLDETGAYFRNSTKPFVASNDCSHIQWGCFFDASAVIHCPYRDVSFMQPLLDSDLDFVVWYKPYIPILHGNSKFFYANYINLAVVDVRNFQNLSLQRYDVSDNWFSWQ